MAFYHEGPGRGQSDPPVDTTPPQYRSGFGVNALQAFVEKGGTLVTFGQAGDLPIQRFGLPLRNIVAELLGEQLIAKRAAAVTVKQGAGKVVLIGFRPQHRNQTHGTFKLVFNALLNDPAE
jgi:hypothetical protein